MVEYVELSGRDAWLSERVQWLERFPIVHPDPRSTPAGDIQEPLLRVCREGRARRRLAVTALRLLAPPVDECLRDEFAINGEHLHPLSAAFGDVHEPIIRDFDAVDSIELRRAGVFRVYVLGRNMGHITLINRELLVSL